MVVIVQNRDLVHQAYSSLHIFPFQHKGNLTSRVYRIQRLHPVDVGFCWSLNCHRSLTNLVMPIGKGKTRCRLSGHNSCTQVPTDQTLNPFVAQSLLVITWFFAMLSICFAAVRALMTLRWRDQIQRQLLHFNGKVGERSKNQIYSII